MSLRVAASRRRPSPRAEELLERIPWSALSSQNNGHLPTLAQTTFAKRSPRLRLFSLSAPFSLIWPSRPTHLRSRRQAQLGSCTSLLHIPSSRLGHTASSLPTTQNNKTRHSVATIAGVLLSTDAPIEILAFASTRRPTEIDLHTRQDVAQLLRVICDVPASTRGYQPVAAMLNAGPLLYSPEVVPHIRRVRRSPYLRRKPLHQLLNKSFDDANTRRKCKAKFELESFSSPSVSICIDISEVKRTCTCRRPIFNICSLDNPSGHSRIYASRSVLGNGGVDRSYGVVISWSATDGVFPMPVGRAAIQTRSPTDAQNRLTMIV
ncbi:hypothetical protein BC629DRAFT_1442596 [Irpex lacteus]|nr:hypothetical protein BC629DRAFT_1442596 [Irpex lacteus]